MKNEKEPIRILNVVPNMRAAGIESFIMNVYRNIDRNKIQFDFLVHNSKKEFYDDEIEKMGGIIYRLSYKDDKNIIKYIKDLDTFFKKHKEYKIIHGHMQSMMPLYLCIAKKNNIPIRIAHSHKGDYDRTLKGLILHIFSRFSKIYSTCNIACSRVAGDYLFRKEHFDIIYNGIDIEKFKFNKKIRKEKKEKLDLNGNSPVLLHVGRFEAEKNHIFLIDMFEKYHKKQPNSVLLLAGEGKLENRIKEKVREKKIENSVKFLGVRNDINEIMQASDFFLLPSLYEGLPVTGIEAQYAGLKCIFSSKVTDEVKILEKTAFIDIDCVDKWVNELDNADFINRETPSEDKFNIKIIAKDMEKRYIEEYKKL